MDSFFLFFLLSGCQNKQSLESQTKFQFDKPKYEDADSEPLYLTYSLSAKDNLDTSFLSNMKAIVDSSEIQSRKWKDC